MLKRTVFIVTLAAFAAVLTMAVTPALAELQVKFSADSLHLTYDSTTRKLDINSQNNAWYESAVGAWLYDTIADDVIDETILKDGDVTDTSFVLDLDVTQDLAGVWHADGPWSLKDKTGVVVAKAMFNSTLVQTVPEFTKDPAFIAQGILSPWETNTSILLGADPWKFQGTVNAPPPAGNGSDGEEATITVGNSGSYSGGTMITTHFLLGSYVDTDTFLTTDHTDAGGDSLNGGWASGTVVPVPAAVVLGFIGLGLVGWRMRKYA